LDWLISVDENLRAQPKHFWNYISKFRRYDHSVTQIEFRDKIIPEQQVVAKPLQTSFPVFTSSFPPYTLNNSDFTCSDFLNTPYISDSGVTCAIGHFHSTKSIKPDELPTLIIEGFSRIFIPLLHHIFSLSFINQEFSFIMEAGGCWAYFQERSIAVVVNYRPILIFNNFCKIFRNILHSNLSFHFKSKLHPNQHGFLKSKSTITDLLTYPNDVTPSLCSQGQLDSIYFDLSLAFDKVPYAVLWDKLNQFGLLSSYVKVVPKLLFN
jgi:hypothetical protein